MTPSSDPDTPAVRSTDAAGRTPSYSTGGRRPRAPATCGLTVRVAGAGAPDEAVVEIAYGGICGSDLHYWQHGAAGESILKAPMLLGHEVVGHRGRRPRPTATARRRAPGWPCIRQRRARGRRPVPGGPAQPVPGLHLPGQRRAFPAHRGGVRALHQSAHPDAARAAGKPACATAAPGGTGQRGLACGLAGRGRGGQAGAGDRLRPDRRTDHRGAEAGRRGRDRRRRHAREAAGHRPRSRREPDAAGHRRRGDRRRRGGRLPRVLRQPPRTGVGGARCRPRRPRGDGGAAAVGGAAGR